MRVGPRIVALPALCFWLQCVSQVLAQSDVGYAAAGCSASQGEADSIRTRNWSGSDLSGPASRGRDLDSSRTP